MLSALLTLVLTLPADAAPKDLVMDALQAELTRSFKAMRKEVTDPPLYYLSYQGVETRSRSLSAVLGSIIHDATVSQRSLDVDARVGSRRLDNTHQIKGAESAGHLDSSASGELPLDDDPLALRQSAWALTDRAVKEAQGRYTKVAADKAVTAGEADDSDDFTAAAPHRHSEPPPPLPPPSPVGARP